MPHHGDSKTSNFNRCMSQTFTQSISSNSEKPKARDSRTNVDRKPDGHTSYGLVSLKGNKNKLMKRGVTPEICLCELPETLEWFNETSQVNTTRDKCRAGHWHLELFEVFLNATATCSTALNNTWFTKWFNEIPKLSSMSQQQCAELPCTSPRCKPGGPTLSNSDGVDLTVSAHFHCMGQHKDEEDVAQTLIDPPDRWSAR